jgi:hypothetical protein
MKKNILMFGVAFEGRDWGATSLKRDMNKTRPQTLDPMPFEGMVWWTQLKML